MQNWPKSEKINWTKFATEHGISGRNRGQTVKEFAMDNQIDVEELDHRLINQRIRAKKLKKYLEPVLLFLAIVQLKE